MDRLMMTASGPLCGEVRISGAKNAALPLLTASILTPDQVRLTNLPDVRDIHTMCSLLSQLGIEVSPGPDGTEVVLNGQGLSAYEAPYDLVKTMRASILALGPLTARLGLARVSLPGGCAIGARPVDLHLRALEKMGAEINIEHGYIEARAVRLQGAEIHFDTVTVTGTENIMMAATLAEGETVLYNAAREPEVSDLAELLIKMGARIQGHGTGTIVIQGVDRLHGAEHAIIPDRIETGTYICAAAITAGHVTLSGTRPDTLQAFLNTMAQAGLSWRTMDDVIEVFPHQGLVAVDVETTPHPGYPTDMQAQLVAVLTQASGRSRVIESIFENRFMHVPELNRMGAEIHAGGREALITGGTPLSGATVMATDLRASAALVLAGLIAEGETIVDRIYHLDRGYANLEGKLNGLGARVRRLSERNEKEIIRLTA